MKDSTTRISQNLMQWSIMKRVFFSFWSTVAVEISPHKSNELDNSAYTSQKRRSGLIFMEYSAPCIIAIFHEPFQDGGPGYFIMTSSRATVGPVLYHIVLPANPDPKVFLDEAGSIKLGDFGSSREVLGRTLKESNTGVRRQRFFWAHLMGKSYQTHQYRSPESVRTRELVTNQMSGLSDAWLLSSVLDDG